MKSGGHAHASAVLAPLYNSIAQLKPYAMPLPLAKFSCAIATYSQEGEGVELHIARARGNKAITLAAQGKFREAVTLHEQARATFAMYGEQEVSVAREELNIAEIYAAQGHFSQALLLFDQSRTIFQQQNLHPQAAEVAL